MKWKKKPPANGAEQVRAFGSLGVGSGDELEVLAPACSLGVPRTRPSPGGLRCFLLLRSNEWGEASWVRKGDGVWSTSGNDINPWAHRSWLPGPRPLGVNRREG